MFCVIQQVEIKKVNRGEAKRIEVYESSENKQAYLVILADAGRLIVYSGG